ncbi:hypothetical protein F4810DRAFT_706572 [Camillea tinctor]|nr:hypothetical protein F4810DRAFT_706572 [Camillea tinctor]
MTNQYVSSECLRILEPKPRRYLAPSFMEMNPRICKCGTCDILHPQQHWKRKLELLPVPQLQPLPSGPGDATKVRIWDDDASDDEPLWTPRKLLEPHSPHDAPCSCTCGPDRGDDECECECVCACGFTERESAAAGAEEADVETHRLSKLTTTSSAYSSSYYDPLSPSPSPFASSSPSPHPQLPPRPCSQASTLSSSPHSPYSLASFSRFSSASLSRDQQPDRISDADANSRDTSPTNPAGNNRPAAEAQPQTQPAAPEAAHPSPRRQAFEIPPTERPRVCQRVRASYQEAKAQVTKRGPVKKLRKVFRKLTGAWK